jgi:hypothetical protein
MLQPATPSIPEQPESPDAKATAHIIRFISAPIPDTSERMATKIQPRSSLSTTEARVQPLIPALAKDYYPFIQPVGAI